MKTEVSIFLASTLLCTGCVQLHRQPEEAEPHAVVVIALDSGSRDQAIVKKIDGRAVRPGCTYRVVPGKHQLTILIMEYYEEKLGPYATSCYRHYAGFEAQSFDPESRGYHILGSSQLGDLRAVGGYSWVQEGATLLGKVSVLNGTKLSRFSTVLSSVRNLFHFMPCDT